MEGDHTAYGPNDLIASSVLIGSREPKSRATSPGARGASLALFRLRKAVPRHNAKNSRRNPVFRVVIGDVCARAPRSYGCLHLAIAEAHVTRECACVQCSPFVAFPEPGGDWFAALCRCIWCVCVLQ